MTNYNHAELNEVESIFATDTAGRLLINGWENAVPVHEARSWRLNRLAAWLDMNVALVARALELYAEHGADGIRARLLAAERRADYPTERDLNEAWGV